MRTLLFVILTLVSLVCRSSGTDALSQRASRAFAAGEWASAQALYMRVSDDTPVEALPYGRIIFAGLMRGDTTVTAPAVERALANHVPLDSVLSVLENEALAHADGNLYVAELHRIGRQMPYLRRPVDARLLKYYTFRSDAPMMIRYAQALLRGLPYSPHYLNILAKAYLIDGDIDAAIATWKRTVAVDSGNLEALVGLGNALYEQEPSAALEYLEKAQEIHPTPYLTSRIASLRHRR